jgi:hypothetical protein
MKPFFISAATSLALSLALPVCGQDVPAQKAPRPEEITGTSGTRFISGVYPHLTAYSQSLKSGVFNRGDGSECGIGAVIPWAGKLWMITYAPHCPSGSEHKLYSIDDKLNMTIHPESVGGTPAARMIHVESEQLLIGHYIIDKTGKVRVISPNVMPGRITAIARHLADPANLAYYYDMEGMLYEVNVHTLEFKKLFNNPVPGEHGKGAYTAQGKLVVANNGKSGGHDNPKDWQVSQEFRKLGPEDRGSLATFDGKVWEVIESRQYTDVTGPQGVKPTLEGANLPLWSIGWDKRAVRLKVLDQGKFHTYLLPKGCYNNDAAHGWFTEWPRIREIGEGRALLDMHGMFYNFPLTFKPGSIAGISPIGRHLRYVPDFCNWNGRLVIATDEASVQGNRFCAQPQSNLWFGTYDDLKNWGEASASASIWAQDKVQSNVVSDPFLINGFKKRIAHFASDVATTFTLEIDRQGTGEWTPYTTVKVEAGGYAQHLFPTDLEAQWIRAKTDVACTASLSFNYSDTRSHDPNGKGKELFAAIADADAAAPLAQLIFPTSTSRDLKMISLDNGKPASYGSLDSETFEFKKGEENAALLKILDNGKPCFTVDAASVIVKSRDIGNPKSKEMTLRLPKGSAAFDKPFANGWPRSEREVESERMLANIHGTFYEVPFWIVGQPAVFYKMKPVCSHNKQIVDFATWRGLLILSGVKADAPAANNLFKSADGKQALWAGGIDDLWQLGKPVGHGGPWLNAAVKAGIPSDPYLMNGYDKKTLTLKADQDCTVAVEIDFDLQSGFHQYRSFALKAGTEQTWTFPDGFAAHWVRFVADRDCTATAQLLYE